MLDRGRPVHPRRGHDDRRARRRAPPRATSTCAREYPHAVAHPAPRDRHRRTPTAASARTCSAAGVASTSHVRVGAGAYICGEETSMLESLEGKRGEVRAKPPIPALEGLFGRPTVVNNVLTLGAVPMILADGGAAYAALGTGRSRGTQVFQLAGNVARGGIVEAAFGVSLRRARRGLRRRHGIRAAGAGGAGRRPARRLPAAVAASTCRWTTRRSPRPARWSGTAASSCSTTPSTWLGMARFAMEFCAKESCGKCTPCRIGSTRGVEVIDRIIAGADDGVRRTTRAARRPLRRR